MTGPRSWVLAAEAEAEFTALLGSSQRSQHAMRSICSVSVSHDAIFSHPRLELRTELDMQSALALSCETVQALTGFS
jgi:hypothetical protein